MKQKFTKLFQRYWTRSGRSFVRNFFHTQVICGTLSNKGFSASTKFQIKFHWTVLFKGNRLGIILIEI